MFALDFEYDNQRLSDYGLIICNFNNASMETIKAGSSITFNKVSMNNGKKFNLTNTQYEECIQTTFTVCKDPKLYKDDMEISNDDYRNVMRWLNRREFLPFLLLGGDEYDANICYYNASFNVSKIMIADALYGLELAMETDKPFGYGERQIHRWKVENPQKSHSIYDVSDEIGSTFPDMKIIVNSSGNLSIHNELEDCTMLIKNCKAGEEIIIYGESQIITSSISSHAIYNDFNFEFFRIGNTITDRNNKITCSLPCSIQLWYSPIIKDTF